MNHPNLSDEINHNLTQSEVEGGVWLNTPEEWATEARKEAEEKGNVLQVGKSIKVQTQNNTYVIEKRSEKEFYISGHPHFCPIPVRAHIHGSTWGW